MLHSIFKFNNMGYKCLCKFKVSSFIICQASLNKFQVWSCREPCCSIVSRTYHIWKVGSCHNLTQLQYNALRQLITSKYLCFSLFLSYFPCSFFELCKHACVWMCIFHDYGHACLYRQCTKNIINRIMPASLIHSLTLGLDSEGMAWVWVKVPH